MSDRSDEALILAYHGGDPSAFGELVRRYAGPVLGYLKQMVGNHEQAEDLFQETFRKVYQRMDSLRNKSQFKPWLFSIATHAANTSALMMRVSQDRADLNGSRLVVM